MTSSLEVLVCRQCTKYAAVDKRREFNQRPERINYHLNNSTAGYLQRGFIRYRDSITRKNDLD